MKIEVTPQTLAVIEQFMATGHYQTEADALQAALDERLDPHTGLMLKDLRPLLQSEPMHSYCTTFLKASAHTTSSLPRS